APTSTVRIHGRLQLPVGTDLDHPRPRGHSSAARLSRPDAGALKGARVLAGAGVGGAGIGFVRTGVVGDVRPEPAPCSALDVPRFRPGAAADGAAVSDGGTGAAGYRRRTRTGFA